MGAVNLVTKYMEKAEKLFLSRFLLVQSAPRPLSSTSLTEKSALPAGQLEPSAHTLRPEQIPPVVLRQLADDVVMLLLPSKGQVRQGGSSN